jgi:hypothetical protein
LLSLRSSFTRVSFLPSSLRTSGLALETFTGRPLSCSGLVQLEVVLAAEVQRLALLLGGDQAFFGCSSMALALTSADLSVSLVRCLESRLHAGAGRSSHRHPGRRP